MLGQPSFVRYSCLPETKHSRNRLLILLALMTFLSFEQVIFRGIESDLLVRVRICLS